MLALKRPLVNITSTFLDLPAPMIDVDNRLAGRLAAAHLLDRGFRNFGFFGNSWTGFSMHREEGFREALAAAGHDLTACYAEFLPRRPANATWQLHDRHVRDWLMALAKPAAILACNDYPARRLAEMCHQLKLRVPEDVALLGIDNDELECLLSLPPLSSVVNPTHKIGFEAARMLDRLMSGRQPPQTTVLIPPAHVVTRQSTDIVAVADTDVSAALAFISVHASENIGPAEVVKGLAIARRALELRFRKLLGRSMLQEIQRSAHREGEASSGREQPADAHRRQPLRVFHAAASGAGLSPGHGRTADDVSAALARIAVAPRGYVQFAQNDKRFAQQDTR